MTYNVGDKLVAGDPYYNILKIVKVEKIKTGGYSVSFKELFGPKHPENYRYFYTSSVAAKSVGKMSEITKIKYSFIKDIFDRESNFWDEE